MTAAFRSLAVHNYRIWFIGALVSNIGGWLQRTAQDWIVIHDLTDNDAFAVGVTMALQFGPQLLFIPIVGFAADHFDTRKLLILTQGVQALLALGLGVSVLTGHVTLTTVYVFALALGVVSAFDAPPRQTFVAQLVGEEYLGNAVSLNSASFNIARMIGPAAAGLLIAAFGSGWVFVLNAASFAAVFASIFFIRPSELHAALRAARGKGQLNQGFRYIRNRADLIGVMVVIFIVATFTFNFPVYIAAMCTTVFGMGSEEFGLFNSALAFGSVVGALLAARRDRPRIHVVIYSCAALGAALAIAAGMPTALAFALALPISGLSMQLMTATANGYVQLTTAPYMRGRVMAVYMAVLAGGTPLGAPIMGWLANEFGARFAVLSGAIAAVVASVAGVMWLATRTRLSTHFRLPGGPLVTIATEPRSARRPGTVPAGGAAQPTSAALVPERPRPRRTAAAAPAPSLEAPRARAR